MPLPACYYGSEIHVSHLLRVNLIIVRHKKNRNGEYVPCSSYAKRPNFSPMNSKRFKRKKNIDKDFKKIGARYGAYSFIIRRSGIKKILNFVKMYGVSTG